MGPGSRATRSSIHPTKPHLFKLGGELPVQLVIGTYYNALRPEFVATWRLRTQIAVIF
jgi:hypothetical protein